ncbi:MAG: phage tail sheath subtilisin-like domain-containing protein [Rhodospirillaceae bacterium]|nr:phage tail sheath subtilisin-like domain-containing protein [Rhodospirillaceae bacterium]
MPEYLTPGVYVEEVSSGIKPIQGVATSTAGFIGEAARGIPNRATLVTGFREFERNFGGHRRGEAGFLAQAVEAFFNAGGRRAFVVRVLPATATLGRSDPVAAREADAWGITRDVLMFEAQGQGAWAGNIRIHVEPSSAFQDVAFRVRVEWVENGRARTVERFDNVRMDREHEDYAVNAINDSSRYIRAVDLFGRDFLDAANRTQPPLPERIAALTTRPVADVGGNPGTYRIAEGAEIEIRWRDAPSGAGLPVDQPRTVGFGNAPVTAAGGTIANGFATLTAAQLTALVAAQANAPDAQFRVTEVNAADGRHMRIEPMVATTAYRVIGLAGGPTMDLSGQTVTLTATDTATPATNQAFQVVFGGAENAVSLAALGQRLQQEIDAAAANTFGVAIDDAGAFLVITAAPRATGVTLALATDAANAAWDDTLPAIAGAAGTIVDAQSGVSVSVGEVIRAGIDPVVNTLFAAARSVGLDENSPAAPGLRPGPTGDNPLRLAGGTDGTGPVTLAQYRGSVTVQGRSGMRAFDTVRINMLVLPGRNAAGFLSEAMAYCDLHDVFLVADGPGSIDRDFQTTAADVRQFVEGLPTRSNNAAMFYPWLAVTDPVGIGRNPIRFVPPSGHMAGIFARTDVARGVWKAPAGIEAVVSGAIEVQHEMEDADQDLLNPIGLNCIRQFPNSGTVVWGSRTLSSDPEWRYVPVRRLALFLKESIQLGMQWAVFEPNDSELWDRIRLNIEAFMLGLFRQGAFQGDTPDEAFRVKCDRETNPQELIDQGIVTALVGFAPVKPAEFVVIQISQKRPED